MDLLYFTLLISSLIFIHESGHFAFAKIFGVKVLTFSIGFGPKIAKLRGKETEYCIGLFPLGGFVKMLEESKRAQPILPEDKKRTFESQALWKRVVIVLAGPLMNLLFPVALYTSVFLDEHEFLPPLVGVVVPGKPADGKLMPGDRILSIDGVSVSTFQESQRLVAARADLPTRFEVQRDGATVELTLTPANELKYIEPRELDITEHIGQVGFRALLPAPVIGVPRTDSPAYRAGLRTFDRIRALNGRKIDRFVELVNSLAANKGDAVVVAYERPRDAPNAMDGLCDVAVLEPQVATLTPDPEAPGGAQNEQDRERAVLARAGIESADMYTAFVPANSSEWKAGLRVGDRVTSLDGAPQKVWSAMEEELGRGANRIHVLAWTRAGEAMAGTFQLRQEQWDDEYGQRYDRYVFRTTHWMPDAPPAYVPNPSPVLFALRRGLDETARAIKFTAFTFLRILQGRLTLSSVGGPITVYDIAGQAGAKGTTYFVWVMALISINLGIINLLPIPVLDGGHLTFFLIEGLSRRPLSLRAREIASLVGVSVLVVLMLVAFKNDVERRWDVIVGQIREIFG